MNENPGPEQSAIVGKLAETQPWLRFIAIMMLIGSGLMLIGGGIAALMGILYMAGVITAETPGGALLVTFGILYVILAGLYLVPALHLLRSARAIRSLANEPREAVIVEALESQRRFWKFVGLATIVFVVLYTLAIAAAVILPAIAAAQNLTKLAS